MARTAATTDARGMAAAKIAAAGVINRDAVYTVREFRNRMRLGSHIWRTVRRGLRTIRLGRRVYIRGADWLAYLDRQAEQNGGDA